MINSIYPLHRNRNTQPVANSNHQRIALDSHQVLAPRPRFVFAAVALVFTLCTALLAAAPVAYAQGANNTVEVSTVNINTADAPTLAAALKGVGESRAVEIVRYREAYGPFGSADELTEVKGIGQSTLDMNRQRITLE